MPVDLEELYDENFYAWQQMGSTLAAKKILPLIFQLYTPDSVVDVGCGIGTWLAVFKDLRQNARILGLDGEYNRDRLLIAPEEFIGCNLEDSLPSFPAKFDLAISLEVAEHLSPERAPSFVKELGTLSDVILFSAAWDGQGGPGYVRHLNEQWHEYWVRLFVDEEFLPVDWVRPQIFNDLKIPACYISNILLFVRKEFLVKTDCSQYKNFNWADIQRLYWAYALRIPHLPRFFERLGTKLDDNPCLIAIKKFFKRLRS